MFEGLFNKEKNNLLLSDYKNIWTKFCFLDESGSLSNPKDPFFTVGFIKCSQPYYLQSKIIYERQKKNFYDEIKFNKLSKNNFDFCKWVLDAFLDTRSISFSSYSLDKEGEYFKEMLGIKEKNFIDSFRNHIFNIFVDKDTKRRLPILGELK